jgi:hypothetical protein
VKFYKLFIYKEIGSKNVTNPKKAVKIARINKINLYICTPKLPPSAGTLAQLVEQRTENPCVTGSIPVGTTLKIKPLQKCWGFFYLSIMYF